MMGVIAGRKNRYRLSSNIFTEQEIFVVSKPECLIIPPITASGRPCLHPADRVLPAVHRIAGIGIKRTVMNETPSRESHELRLELCDQCCNIFTQPVITVAEYPGRE
ncbi:hypothetical protein D3C79_946080 [compost metagenome]